MKLLLSGGHPSPAFAVVDTLRAAHPEVELAFIGRLVAQDTTGQLAGEATAVSERHIPFYSINTAKWGRSLLQKMFAFGTVMYATMVAYGLVKKIKPNVFLSFGSYVALPVAIACKLSGVPVVTHEQTRVAGLSNQIIAKWATKVAISYPESARYFPKQKTVLTGLPLRPQLFQASTPITLGATVSFRTSQLPIVYITGGSSGSNSLNEFISHLLPQLLMEWRVIHTCGRATVVQNWSTLLLETKRKLPSHLQDRYLVAEQLDVTDLTWIYRQKTVVFGRAGANTAAEVAAFGLPAIFVPLPLSNYDEQQKNAEALLSNGQTVIINQADLTAEVFFKSLHKLQQKLAHTAPLLPLSVATTATEQIIQLCFNAITNRT